MFLGRSRRIIPYFRPKVLVTEKWQCQKRNYPYYYRLVDQVGSSSGKALSRSYGVQISSASLLRCWRSVARPRLWLEELLYLEHKRAEQGIWGSLMLLKYDGCEVVAFAPQRTTRKKPQFLKGHGFVNDFAALHNLCSLVDGSGQRSVNGSLAILQANQKITILNKHPKKYFQVTWSSSYPCAFSSLL